ncbi:HD domain-containing protein [Ferrimonas lipolytica]|uniref:HD domain-containing protein n=1 Tax=Ferrimonas lipolytica TaxID=2724191 RepID=A0A6H1UGP9_9GAMM|nr:HD domain-containing protein [Ferrimonas lipolytica]QIZ78285.1 HD domain-containing protein [Ferrimonas lipolytica]
MNHPFDASWQQLCHAWAEAAGRDGAHDVSHIERVAVAAKQLAQAEGADLAVVLPAAWLHDVVLVDKRDERRDQASKLSADKAIKLLDEYGYPSQHLDAIHHAIVSHSWSAGVPCETIEAKVVQDADRLDALGAIGLSRCLMLGGQWERDLYHPTDPLAKLRSLDDDNFNIDHFFVKLQHLPGSMTTEAGKAEGQRRWQFMQQYLDQLMLELGHG